ncbi:unnamed protein product [Adineta steineri]|uniref:Zinc transporter ZIP14 n=1 Tax=Adineta steineri TaxID=433720 RepID=A0A818XN15_9BILA|nr:unnamed protein product [Adineta steineri]CAF3739021.1 unnamed protein product [Adineta steineri]
MMKLSLIILIFIGYSSVWSFNIKLSRLEQNLLYSNLNNEANLKLFYEKLIESNGVDKPTELHEMINDKDIQEGNIQNKCFESTSHLLTSLNIKRTDENINLTRTDINRVTPILANIKFNEGCQKPKGTTKWKNILFGLVSITVVNLTALFGAIILPFRKKPAFKWILSTFIGLAVGTLLGTGIFHLIPMAFSVEDYDKELTFLTKGLIAIIIIYLFYMRDQLSKVFFHVQTAVSTHEHGDEDISPILHQKNTKSLKENLQTMKPIGWMILVSDLLHGFIDGLTIGAIAMVSIGDCLRMMVPIVCEEFSHKLGDTAILLSSGLPIKQALLMNFLSACGCYPGFFLGAKLGQLENFHPWVCALAGGMFIYIGLADMIPELISMGDEIEKDFVMENKTVSKMLKIKILITQNLGVIAGIAIMFLLAKYGEVLSEYF